MNRRTRELNQQNNELDNKIKEENQEVFTNMICYLRGSKLSEYDIEVVRQDLTEMVLSAQERGENIDSVIGGNYQEFCDNVIASLPPKTIGQRVFDVLDVICMCLSILLLINIVIARDTIRLVQDLIQGNAINNQITFSIGQAILSGAVIAAAYVIVELILRNALREWKAEQKVILGICLALSILTILVGILGQNIRFTMNIFLAVTLTVGLFMAHKIFALI